MPYSVQTKDGIKLNNIPDDIAPDSDIIKQRVTEERARLQQPTAPAQPASPRMAKARHDQVEQPQIQSSGAPELDNFNPADFSETPMQPRASIDPGVMDQIHGVVEAAVAAGSGATGGTVGGMAGALEQMAKELASGEFGSPDAAERIAENSAKRAEQLTITPKTEIGIKRTQQLSEALKPLAGLPPAIAEAGAIGQGLKNVTPIAKAKVVRSVPGRNNQAVDYLNEQLSPKAQKITQSSSLSAPDIDNFTPRFENKKMADMRRSIQDGTVDGVGFKLKNGRVVSDPLQRDLVKKGINEKLIVSPNTMNAATKKASSEMLDLAERFIRGESGSERNRPQTVIGNNAMKRFDFIAKAQDDAGKRITKAVNSELKGTPVDVADLVDNYLDDLGVLKVKVNENGGLDFSESILTGPTKPIKDAFRMVKNNEFDSADDLHRIKQSLSNLINYDSKVTEPIDARVQGAISSLRGGINERLRGLSENYAKANDDYARPAKVLTPFTKEMGRRFDPENDRVGNFVGQELRKTITNYGKANDLISAIDDLDVMARELGGKFNDDLMAQVMLNSELERTFGTFVPGSMQGVIEKGTEVAANRFGIAGEIAKAGLNEAKDRIRFRPPSKDKLELIKQLKQLMAE